MKIARIRETNHLAIVNADGAFAEVEETDLLAALKSPDALTPTGYGSARRNAPWPRR